LPKAADSHSFLPLTEATFFILLSLAPGAKHGYAIMKDVSYMSNGRITFSTGTLYGALKRLLDLGWIERSGEEGSELAETSRSRKEYKLTALGKAVFTSETSRMKELVQLATAANAKEG